MTAHAPVSRWPGSRLASSLLMAIAALGSVSTALSTPVLDAGAARPIYVGAAAAGMLAGWLHMRRGLGAGLGRDALGGISVGVTGTICFFVLAGVGETVRAYRFTQFDNATALLDNLVLHMIDVFCIVIELLTLLTLLIGAATAGMYAEHFRRVWD
jgi:hypothetical protein